MFLLAIYLVTLELERASYANLTVSPKNQQQARDAELPHLLTVRQNWQKLSSTKRRWRRMGENSARSAISGLIVISAAAAYHLGPDWLALSSQAVDIWYLAGWTITPLAAAAGCFRASTRSSNADQKAWRDLGFGCVLWAAGTIAWQLEGGSFPGIGDVGYILSSLFIACGMFRYSLQSRMVSAVQFLDFAIAGCAITLALLVGLRDTIEASVLSSPGTAIAVLYPASSLAPAAFGVMCLVLYTPVARRLPARLLVLAMAAQAIADLFYGISEMRGSYVVGMSYDSLWVMCFLLLLWASCEHIWRLRDNLGHRTDARRWHAEAFVPAAAVGLAAMMWGLSESEGMQPIAASPALAAALALLLGLREHLMLRNERALRFSADAIRSELESVLESTTDSVAVLDRDWNVVYRNAKANELLGFDEEINLWEAFPDAIGSAFDLRYREAMATQEPVEFEEFLPSAGRFLEVHAYPAPSKLTVFFRDVTDRRRQREQIEFLALRDPLTGLANRHVFQKTLKTMLSRGHEAAVLCLDLDTFKEVNDTFGHPTGDELLVSLAERLTKCVGEAGTLARMGGDEFAVALETGMEGAEEVARRILASHVEPFVLTAAKLNVRASIGIATSPKDACEADQLFRKADIALYHAKAEGGDAFRFFHEEMERAILDRQVLKSELSDALSQDQFELAFQPIIGLADDSVQQLETLLRWRHPTRGMVPPDRFIPIIEETGAITAIGEWLLRRACAAAAEWPTRIGVAVNLSACQFRASDLPALVSSVLASSGLSPARLELEITESVLLHDSENNLSTLRRLRDLGVQIALDDFGTGYSSLSYLRTFPFTRIKIDRSFVKNVDLNGEAQAIIRSIVDLGQNLEMDVTAEGVETRQELDCLRGLGCNAAQGFFIGMPVQQGTELSAIAKVETDRIWRTSTAAAAARRG